MPVMVISNSNNLGFPAAINQGLRAARGDYLLLNNDAVVTDGWLSQLVALAEMDQAGTTKHTKDTKREDKGRHGGSLGIGLVGPMSNYARRRNWSRMCHTRPWKRCMSLRDGGAAGRGQWFTAGKLSGFCLLMKRAVYEAVGGLDEQFGLGLFDDDDLAERGTPGRLRAGHGA